LQNFKLTTKNNDAFVLRFVDSEWLFMNTRQNELLFEVENIRTKAQLLEDINFYITVAFGQLQ